ncbi:hypothetical protein [Flavobacterium panacagri]|uniref:hypothetical protein n=1 Tax=Flavobacterium panacagri TaxID=3034146 RepID=UPI0025A5C848|nr:hypothetical protein [Flavobacterium panacagri]
MAKTKLFNKGDVILTNPEEDFWGIAVVLSEREKTPNFSPQCHIAVTPLLFQKEIEFSELNIEDLVPLEFEREYTFEKQKKKPKPFSRTEICIGVYTRNNKADFKIIGNINPEKVYTGNLPFEPLMGLKVTFPVCGHPEKFWLGREAYIVWQRKNSTV